MASKVASRLKANWMEMPDDWFEPLTFGELKVGQKFICLPCPGDNGGHGGFRGVHEILTKTHQRIFELAPGLTFGTPHGRAMDNQGISSACPDSMTVILVE